ncbi:MAG: hypothetical protein IPQ06_15555 [Chitinophagaceae bacterium]|nr:hypothetical protein [Chitinophagaceae bacterium]
MIYKGEMIAKMDTTVTKLTDQQKEDLGAMTGFKEKLRLESKIKKMEKSLKAVRGSYGGFLNIKVTEPLKKYSMSIMVPEIS